MRQFIKTHSQQNLMTLNNCYKGQKGQFNIKNKTTLFKNKALIVKKS